MVRTSDKEHQICFLAAAIDHGIGEIGRDDLPPQAMVFHRIGEFVPNLVREVLRQFAGEIGMVRHAGDEQVIGKAERSYYRS
jgi:hypothetical protein